MRRLFIAFALACSACGSGGGPGSGQDQGTGDIEAPEAEDGAGADPAPVPDPGTTETCTGPACLLPGHCSDHKRNEGETDLDCGGECAACGFGKACERDEDCVSGSCISFECSVPSCIDGVQNATESDVDCGGGCPACVLGKRCNGPADCTSLACTDGVCIEATCDDGKRNGSESDIDCGGAACEPCKPGKTCARHGDCTTRLCDQGVCKGCTSAPFCPGDDTPCRKRTCVAGVCGFEDVAAGTDAGTQAAKDCKRAQCDGKGAVEQVPDDQDIPDDGRQCTDDLCDAGTPSNPPSQAGKACAQGDGKVCDGKGTCVQCVVPEDCASKVCNLGKCLSATCVDGVQNGAETDIDCGGGKCGGCDIGRACTEGTDCLSGFCDGTACVECLLPGDCPAPASTCQAATCLLGVCGVEDIAEGEPATAQEPGDCEVLRCDGKGNGAPELDPADVPVDGNPCTDDRCVAGTPSNPKLDAGTPCGEGGAPGGPVCDGDGACVECLDPPCPVVLLAGGGPSGVVTGQFRAGKGWTLATVAGSGPAASASLVTFGDRVVGFVRAPSSALRWVAWHEEAWTVPIAFGDVDAYRAAPALAASATRVHAALHASSQGHLLTEFDGAAWSDPVAAGSPPVAGPAQAAVAASATGVTVLFADASADNRLRAVDLAGTVWGAPVDVASDAIFSVPPALIATSGAADRLAAWVRFDGKVMFARRSNVGWTAPSQVPGAASATQVSLAALPDGRVAAAWTGLDGRPAASILDGATWSDAGPAVPSGVTSASPPSIAPGIAGADLELAYLDAAGRVQHVRLIAGEWTAPAQAGGQSGLSCAAIATVF